MNRVENQSAGSASEPKDEWYYLTRDERERLLEEWGAIRAAAVGQGAAVRHL